MADVSSAKNSTAPVDEPRFNVRRMITAAAIRPRPKTAIALELLLTASSSEVAEMKQPPPDPPPLDPPWSESTPMPVDPAPSPEFEV